MYLSSLRIRCLPQGGNEFYVTAMKDGANLEYFFKNVLHIFGISQSFLLFAR